MSEIGNMHITANGFEWNIHNFLHLSAKMDESYLSPSFNYNGESWFLQIWPNRNSYEGTTGYVDLHLAKEFSDSRISVEVSLALRNANGKKDMEIHSTEVFNGDFHYRIYSRFLSRSELKRRKSLLVPSGILTVVCSLKDSKSTENASDTATACSYCKETFDSENLSLHEKECTDKQIKCQECSEFILSRSWNDYECPKERAEVSEKLIQDFKTMLSGDHSDMVVKVNEEEFKLHKVILAARNPYFYSMFKNDMKEKSTGVVIMQDCEPGIFRSFIHFLYTGKADKLSPENVCGLYKIADKYQEVQLKRKCLHFLLNTLSVESFCDYFLLALTYDEEDLFQLAIELFKTKGKEIARTVKWQNFVKEYPTQANELFIKTLDHYIK